MCEILKKARGDKLAWSRDLPLLLSPFHTGLDGGSCSLFPWKYDTYMDWTPSVVRHGLLGSHYKWSDLWFHHMDSV